MNNKEPLITKEFILLFLFSVAVCTGMNMLNVIVPLYVTETLQRSTATAGLMTTVYTIAACAFVLILASVSAFHKRTKNTVETKV